MRRSVSCGIALCVFLAWAGVLGGAQDFKSYPGSKLDGKASREASEAAKGMECQVFTTADGFDKVHAFYKPLYKEYSMPAPPPKLPSGQQVKWAFFILDGGKDLSNSKYWMKIQWPYLGEAQGTGFKDIRDVTVIQTVRRK